MDFRVPKELRSNATLRQLHLGIDLPSWFCASIKEIDKDLHFIWSDFECIYDDIMNQYTGSNEDPRFCIGPIQGSTYEVWGWPLKLNKDEYKPNKCWHLWRIARPHGWAHVIEISSREPEYLQFLLERLHKQAVYKNKYGHLAWNKLQQDEENERKEKAELENKQKFDDLQKENKRFIKIAMENLASGITAPSNPVKEIITSFGGQTNKSRIIRPITDEEGGIIH